MRAFKAVPILFVGDVKATLAWFQSVLGWEDGFVWPEDVELPEYGSSNLGDATIHISRCDDESRRGKTHTYVFVSAVDKYAEDIKSRGGQLDYGPETTDYGMREFSVLDPDGNRICFGEGAS